MSARALTDASDRLNEQLVRAERVINSQKTGVRASVPLGAAATLIFGREGGVWGLYVEHPGGASIPLLKASREVRILAAHALGDLMSAIHDEVTGVTRQVEEAIRAAEMFVSAYSTASGDPDEGT